jgi:hypothetical protein
MGGQETAELAPGELAAVDVDHRIAIGAPIVDQAPEHVAPRSPLVARLEILDLRLPRRDLDCHVLVFGPETVQLLEVGIETVEDLLVRHPPDLGAEPEVGGIDPVLGVFDDRTVRLAGDPDLVEGRDVTGFSAHGGSFRDVPSSPCPPAHRWGIRGPVVGRQDRWIGMHEVPRRVDRIMEGRRRWLPSPVPGPLRRSTSSRSP